jgi:DNA-directed RNA polymerase specialized sigma24 family protein
VSAALVPGDAFISSNAPERHVTEGPAPPHDGKHLDGLVARIATGDRSAFQSLYALLAMRVWRDASRLMPHAADSQAVTRSTFVEVWHLARHHLDDGGLHTDAWIAAISAQKIEERLRALDTPHLVREDYDRHTYREFAAMIGAGRTAAELTAGQSRMGPLRAPESTAGAEAAEYSRRHDTEQA